MQFLTYIIVGQLIAVYLQYIVEGSVHTGDGTLPFFSFMGIIFSIGFYMDKNDY